MNSDLIWNENTWRHYCPIRLALPFDCTKGLPINGYCVRVSGRFNGLCHHLIAVALCLFACMQIQCNKANGFIHTFAAYSAPSPSIVLSLPLFMSNKISAGGEERLTRQTRDSNGAARLMGGSLPEPGNVSRALAVDA